MDSLKINTVDISADSEYLELARQNKIPLGLGLGIDLDDNLRFKRGNFNIILGHANVGKTYWLLWYLLAHSKVNNLKHLIHSSENTTKGLRRNLIELSAQKKINQLSLQELEEHKQFINNHFTFTDSSKRLYTIEEFMKGVQGWDGYDSIMIDPHNSFLKPRGVNSHEYDYEVASRLRLYAKKTNTAVYLCTHASTEALRKTHPKQHEFEGLPVPPNAADAEGGGKWVNRADDFIVIHRYVQSEELWMVTEIHCKKIKETETGGKPTFLNEPVRFRLHNGTQFLSNGRNAIQ